MINNVLKVFLTNTIKVFTSIVTTFIIPMFLNIDNYALLKLYQLYVSYIGVFHLGFIDGIFLKYGGKEIDESNMQEVSQEQNTLFVYQIILTLLIIIISFLNKDIIIFFFALSFIPTTMIDFYRSIYQAIGNFDKYSKMLNFLSIANLIVNLLLIFVFKTNNYIYFLIAYTIVNYIVLVYAMFEFYVLTKVKFYCPSVNIFIRMVKLGFVLMIGNFSYILFLGLDKWFIKWFLTLNDFAYYNFASSILSIINMFIGPISLTLYTYLCQNKKNEFHIKIKRFIMPFFEVLLCSSFFVVLIIRYFIPLYAESIHLVFLLIFAQLIINYNITIFVNLFKAYNLQKTYLLNLVIVIFFSFAINCFLIFIYKNSISLALGTVISMLFWTILNMKSFDHLKFSKKELFHLLCITIIYFSTSLFSNYLVGTIIFCTLLILLDLFEYKEELSTLYNIIVQKFLKRV